MNLGHNSRISEAAAEEATNGDKVQMTAALTVVHAVWRITRGLKSGALQASEIGLGPWSRMMGAPIR